VAERENVYSRRTFGRYRLFDAIASGGMATVHFGRLQCPPGAARTVAVKRLHAEYTRDPEFTAMFLDEARLAARVDHPNVVRTLDVVVADGELLLVMEYVRAISLADLLLAAKARGERPPIAVAAAVLAGVLRGLHAAHEAEDEDGAPLDIVHRDVSPHNVLVGDDGQARVIDFGVARAAGRAARATREGQVKGKFAYMAPEQVTNVGVTRQSDVFAASIVLWETLAGERLFQAESESALLARVLTAPIPPPSTVEPRLPPGLDAVVMRGLARDLSFRYSTAREMALALAEATALADAAEVGAWVARLGGEELAKRAARVREIEQEAYAEPAPPPDGVEGGAPAPALREEPPQEPAPVHPRRDSRSRARGRGLWALAAGAGLGAAALVVAVFSARTPPLRAAEPGRGPEDRSAPALAADVPVPGPPPAAASVGSAPMGATGAPAHAPPAATGAGTSSRRAVPTAKPGLPAPAPAPSRASRAADCDPPYYVDASGHLIYKSECFR
jgi:serine/threonine-protein kinase